MIKYQEGLKFEEMINQVIWGNCLEVLKNFPDESIDLMLTDPPYNAKNIGPQQKKYSVGPMQLPNKEYRKWCKDWFKEAKRVSKRLVFTPGIANICNYPQPDWVIAWHKPAAVSFNRFGGFNAWEPIFLYGKIPKGKHLKQDYILCNTENLRKGVESDHPCPKPIKLWEKLVDIFSNEKEIIGDCFMGSGTTALVAKMLGRKFISIEISEKYCKIADDRLRQEVLF